MIAISNMEKPKSCAECDYNYFEGFKGYESNYCSALKRPYNNKGFEINPFKERLHDCSLIEIVTCEECAYNTNNTDGDNRGWCYKHGIDIIEFCSEGERWD